MGGYGAIRIGMKNPGLFSSMYILSACCLMNNPAQQVPAPRGEGRGQGNRGNTGSTNGAPPVFANVVSAEAAAWSPNPKNPPQYFDLPTKDGQAQPAVVAKWIANSPLAMVDQYVSSLKQYKAIAGDVGLQDGLIASNKELDEALSRLGIVHTFEAYEGDHVNHIQDRLERSVLPFFSKNLDFTPAKR
jgi:S-formylglutathione hydrolase FrmB